MRTGDHPCATVLRPATHGSVTPIARLTWQVVLAPPINRLITELSRFPGVGQRTAQRMAFHLLRVSDEEALALADAIRDVKEQVGECEVCFNLATEPLCRICQDDRRDAHVLCVVEERAPGVAVTRLASGLPVGSDLEYADEITLGRAMRARRQL